MPGAGTDDPWGTGGTPIHRDPGPFEPPREGGPARSRIIWGAAVAALIVVGAGSVLWFTLGDSEPPPRPAVGRTASVSREPSPSPSGEPNVQATSVNALLSAGKEAHDRLEYGTATCDDLAASVSAFEQIVDDRNQELSAAQEMSVDLLARAEELKQALVDSYRYSLAADQAYLRWARAVAAQDCGAAAPPETPDVAAAHAADDDAANAKRRFVALWNPIAPSYGLPTYRWNEL